MDGPKNANQVIQTFPPEIWASITVYLSGEEIGRLKMTGSKGLWCRLCARRSVKSITLGTDFLVFKRWPAFVNELDSLEELVIRHENPSLWYHWQPKLDNVPRTLKRLKLDVDPQTDHFFFVKKTVPLSLSEYVPNLEVLDIKLDWSPDSPWMAHTPSTLTILKIGLWTSSMPFPPSLIHLKCHKIDITADIQLPSQLQSISAGRMTNLSIIPLLPPSFTKIKVERLIIGRERANLSLLSTLPSSMEKILLLDLWAPPAVSQSLTIPNHLKVLTIMDLPVSDWHILPPTLTTFRLLDATSLAPSEPATLIHPLTKEKVTLKTIPLHILPASLTDLELRFLGTAEFPIAPSQASQNLFPASLISLRLSGFFLTVESAKLLPASLRFLSMSRIDALICEQLPRNLTRLVASNAIMVPDLIKFLPRGLKYFWTSPVRKDDLWNDPYTANALEVHEVQSLYFSESISKDKIWEGDACLPPAMTELSLNYFRNLSDEFLFQRLPNLTKLDLPLQHNFTDSSIACLSRVLRTLELPECAKVSGKCFPSLPKTLTRLNLSASKDIEDSDIQHLPSALKTLIIDRATKLTDSCVKYLPRHLEVIQLKQNTNITTNVVGSLPPCMRSLQIACSITTRSWSLRKGVVSK